MHRNKERHRFLISQKEGPNYDILCPFIDNKAIFIMVDNLYYSTVWHRLSVGASPFRASTK